MLKLPEPGTPVISVIQPPSGGCVLKHDEYEGSIELDLPAAFRRLCVETENATATNAQTSRQPPSGGCVLKQNIRPDIELVVLQPPSGGCVLKLLEPGPQSPCCFAAAFRRLCVETKKNRLLVSRLNCQPPSGGCVLKPVVTSVGMALLSQPPSGGCVLKQFRPQR